MVMSEFWFEMELMEGLKAKFRDMGIGKFSEKYSRLRPRKWVGGFFPLRWRYWDKKQWTNRSLLSYTLIEMLWFVSNLDWHKSFRQIIESSHLLILQALYTLEAAQSWFLIFLTFGIVYDTGFHLDIDIFNLSIWKTRVWP